MSCLKQDKTPGIIFCEKPHTFYQVLLTDSILKRFLSLFRFHIKPDKKLI